MKPVRYLSIIVLAVLIAACGFQLRGASVLPVELQQIQLIGDKLTTNQKSQLSELLEKAGASLQNSNLNNPVQLSVTLMSLPERNLADAGGTGQTIVRITKQLSYSVKKPEDKTTGQTRSIERQTDIAQDSNNLLGTISEKQSADEALERTLFNQLIYQLKRL